jgi:hypothetical protein
MPVENFLEKMNALVEELKAHPKVTLLNYYVPAPATDQDFADVEAHIGMALPADIKAFYRQCNGIQLRWVHKDNKNVDQKLWSSFMDGPFDYEEIVAEKYIDGVINILPIKQVFLTDWIARFGALEEYLKPASFLVCGVEVPADEFLKQAYIFDLYNDDFHFYLLLSPKLPGSVVCVGADFHKSIKTKGFTYFSLEAYLNYAMLKKGSVFDRHLSLYLKSQIKSAGRSVVFAKDSSDPLIFTSTSLEKTYYHLD